VEHHGENPKQNVVAIIPARYASVRLPGKLLLDIAGEALIIHTVRRAVAATLVSRVLVAADDERIVAAVTEAGFEAVMTSKIHASGSDRIAEVAESLPEGTIIVNVQGDEPTIAPETIDRAIETMRADPSADIVTTSEPIDDERDVLDPNVVKVVTDTSGNALYFSRSPIPFLRAGASLSGGIDNAFSGSTDLVASYRKHTGLYVYRREFLLRFSKMKQTPLEKLESLEQLRALENGAKIRVVETFGSSIGVDTEEDLERVREIVDRLLFSRVAK